MNKIIAYCLFSIVLLSVSCKRDVEKDKFVGPLYVTTSEDLQISANPADFTAGGSVFFKAKLTKSSAWKLKITGNKSGAYKVISDTSQVLDMTNTSWDGSSDTTVKFMSESCTATLYMPESDNTKSIEFSYFLGPFSIVEDLAINAKPVDFTQNVYFTAKLNRIKSWTLTIKGQTSGAVKRIKGYDNTVNLANATWDGSSDTTFFFRKSETCIATLSFPDTSLVQSIDFTLNTAKTHTGYLICDYESTTMASYTDSYIGNYFDAADKATSVIDLLAFSPAPEGAKVLSFNCNDVNSSYYTGGAYHNSKGSNFGIPAFSSDSVYLNMFVYGYSGGNAALSIEIKESDGDSWKPAQLSINWVGWKLVSFKLANATDGGSTGNKIKESAKINAVNISMNSIPQGQNCKALVDYLIFTTGSVLKP
ncbi:MAG: hypothetical protein U0V72_15930 [Cytophagales bacterium]